MNFHLKTAWYNIRRSPFQALSAMFVLSLTFFVISLLSILLYSSNELLKYFETRPQVIVFLKDDITKEELSQLREKLSNDRRIKDVNFVSKEEAVEIYKKATSDNPLLSELVSPSIFPASLEFSLIDLSYAQGIVEELKKESGVDSIGFTASLGEESSLGDVVNRLKKFTMYLKIGGGSFAALLSITSFLVLIVIIGMRMTARRGEIEILSFIGATPWFIRSPILLEAIIYSFFGVLIGWLSTFILVLYSTPSLLKYFGDIPILPRDTVGLITLFGIIFLGEVLIGLFLAVVGSILALSRAKAK